MKSLTRLFLMATVCAPAFAVPAWAQTAGDRAGATSIGEEIIVTARKREETLLDVPVPVSVATQAQLTRDQIYTITDLQRVSPALEVSQTSGGEYSGGARMRGIGTGVANASVSPSTVFQVDQVPQGLLAFPQLFDMAQVEILRGPQGTLFGQGASAGVINVTTVAPNLHKIEGYAGIDAADQGTFGSEFGQTLVRAALNVPLSSKIALRVSGQFKDEKGLQRNITLDKPNDIKDMGLRTRLLFEPTDGLKINLAAEWNKTNNDGYNFFAQAIAPTNPASLAAFTSPTGACRMTISQRAGEYCSDTDTNFKIKTQSYSGVVDLKVTDNLALTSVTAYRTIRREYVAQDFLRLPNVPAARLENTLQVANQFSQELRFNYSGHGLHLVVGSAYTRFDYDQLPLVDGAFGQTALGSRIGFSVCLKSGVFCVPLPPAPVTLTRESTVNSTLTFFSDATYSLTPQFDVFGGLRYSHYRDETGVGFNTLTPTRSIAIKDDNVSGRIGVSFKPSRKVNIYASFARGYKPPAVVVPVASSLPVVELKPETSSAFEIGGKLKAHRMQVEANVFYTSVAAFQAQTSVFSGGSLVSQALNLPGKINSYGFELTTFGHITNALSVSAGYQFNVVKFPSGYLGDDGLPLGGTQFINAPRHKITLSGEYAKPVSGNVEAFINANTVYKSDVLLANNGDPRYRYPAHAIVGGAIGVRAINDAWRVSLYVRNLTKQREPTAYLASTFAGSTDGGIRAWPVAGLTARQVGLSLDMKF